VLLVGGACSGGGAAAPAKASASPSRSPSPSPPGPDLTRPFAGRLLIADRGNNRLLLVNAAKQVLWTYPSPTAAAPPGGFYFPDDAFFVHHGTAIISNQEENHTVVQIGFPTGTVDWQYGHPRKPGSAAGYLDQPDDAYLLADGVVAVADASNCRILLFDPAQISPSTQLGTTRNCTHNPPTSFAYPNGDTPLPNGNLLISEANAAYIDEVTQSGQLVWSVHLAIAYPSDPQQIGPDLYLVADYARPGGIYEFTREGQIVYAYHPAAGDGMLDHPSLAEMLPNGLLCANDDYRHRVVVIDPATNAIVWQYGTTGVKGTAPGLLNIPDGFDVLAPDSTTPTHPSTG
jgi:outer membrane protein assembly factor BamB